MFIREANEAYHKLLGNDSINIDKRSKILTTSSGRPVDSNQQSTTIGSKGQWFIYDFELNDKLTKFDSDRIPEIVIYVKGVCAIA